MRLKGGYTPKEFAISIALDALTRAYDGRTDDVHKVASTQKQIDATCVQIAKLHNSLLRKAGTDAPPLAETKSEGL